MNKTNLITFTLLIAILAAVIMTAIIPVAFAQLVPNAVLNPENGNYYEYRNFGTDWSYAKGYAEGYTFNNIRGHLVTITSQSENDFVTNLIPDDKYAWIALTDEDTEGTFTWATGEPFNYTNWEEHQPNNRYGTEDYAEMNGDTGKWNDTREYNHTIRGLVMEFTTPATVQNPDNGHYYQYIFNTDATWTDAKLLAETSYYNGIAGYLATITSQSENDFVTNLIADNSYAWIGLTDEDTEGTYTWVTDESYNYTNWDSSQPNNKYDGEHYAEISKDTGKWNDSRDNHRFINGYVVEYDFPPAQNPVNQHYYEFIADDGISWTDAKTAAENSTHDSTSGHLVTITSQSENDFVAGLVPDNSHTWIGLTDEVTEGTYEWVTGESFSYTNWDANQPDGSGSYEDYVEFFSDNKKWSDNMDNHEFITGYVVEYTDEMIVLVTERQEIVGIGKSVNIQVFGAKQLVDIEIIAEDDEIIEEFAFPASSTGEINQPWIIPPDTQPGTYTVKVSDEFNSAEATFEIE